MRGIAGLTIGATLAATGAGAIAQSTPAQAPRLDNQAVIRTCVPPGQENRPMSDLTPAQRTEFIACALREAAGQLAAQLPLRADDVTVLRSVSVEGARLTYQFELAVDAGQLTAEQRAGLVQATRANACGRENMRDTMSYGGSYRYIWNDRAGTEIARTTIEGC